MAHSQRLRPVVDDDEVLVARVLRGDPQAFRDLYGRHGRYVAGVVFRLMGDDADLEDIVQDTFVRAAERLASLRNPAQVRPWLVTIAVRLAQSRMTRRRRRSWLRQQIIRAAPTVSDPRDRAPADELYSALDQVPDKLRIPWILARVEGQKLEDVAAACDTSLATVKRRIAQAQTRLDRRLGAGA
ncbi:MAG: RNA polymerase sigma factor [Deltaproteobacteria bacterium]|nr:RNA polymerase sigma factor [Deltaproteobacteria bacterium]